MLTNSCLSSQTDLDLARQKFFAYAKYYHDRKHHDVFTFLMHQLLHICDDAERFQCGLGYISAYMFETFLAMFPTVCRPFSKFADVLC